MFIKNIKELYSCFEGTLRLSFPFVNYIRMTKIGKPAISVNNPAFRKCSLTRRKIKQLSACFSPRVYSNESEQRTTVMTTLSISMQKCRISQCEPVPSLPLSEFSNLSQDYLRWKRVGERENG